MNDSIASSDFTTSNAASVAAIYRGDRLRGSGCFIRSNLLLTASFICLSENNQLSEDISIKSFNGTEFRDCELIWLAREAAGARLALLRVNDHKINNTVDFGKLVRPGPRNCNSFAFVSDATLEDTILTRGVNGTVDPSTYPGMTDILAFQLPILPQVYRAFGGAPVFYEQYLIGTIVAVDADERTYRLISAASALEDSSFRNCLAREIGHVPDLVDLPFSEPTVIDALKDVSKADPSNIQEVAAAQLLLSNSYYENVLEQARRSFNAAVVAATAGLAFFLAAVIFAVVMGKLAAPLVSSLAGGVVEVVAGLNFWLYGRTATQLNAFHQRLERMQRFLVANSVSASLTRENRETALLDLVKVISAGVVESSPPADGG